MTQYQMYLISHDSIAELWLRVEHIVATNDLKDWDELYHSLVRVHAKPSISFKRISSIAEPITQCQYHANLPDLVQHELPDPRSIRWALRRIVEMTAHERCHGDWAKFGGDYPILIKGHVLPRHPNLRAAHEDFVSTVLAAPAAEIPELSFLHVADAYCSVLKPETIARLVQQEDETSYLATAAAYFMSQPDNLTKIFGRDIKRMEYFLRMAAMRPKRSIWFTAFAT